MNSEITDNAVRKPRGWIFYDGSCGLCVQGRNRTGRLFGSRGYEWLPLQTHGSATRLGVAETAFETRMHLLTADGCVLHNADALGALCRSVWWLWPLGVLLLLPGFRGTGHLIYDWLARNRHRISHACKVEANAEPVVHLFDCILALLPLLIVGVIGRHLPAWQWMWALTFALGLGLKWLAWRDALLDGACPPATRAFAWFALWPGMNGRAFLSGNPVKRPQIREWFSAILALSAGTTLVWIAAPILLAFDPICAAWLGMIGIVLLLHFGVIRMLSICLRHFGISAAPIMNAPLRATSLGEFWGARWNTAFSIPARRLILLPLAKHVGLGTAGFAVFLISGLVHELVISLPAHAGFGLPTLYFALQGAGVALERSRFGRGYRLKHGIKGWLFVMCFVVGPVYWLFHPAFVQAVIIPFLKFLNSH